MLVPLSWLKEYVNLDMDPDELAHVMTMTGCETVNLGSPIPDFKGVVTARIEKIERHPDADKLSVCQVVAQKGAEPLTIVCGASNISEGDLVPLAAVGTELPGDFKIKKTKIRGVTSHGMLCSERELGMSEDHSGIWILPAGLEIGLPLPKALGSDDAVIETEPTPNRGDMTSVLGTAREVAAITGDKARPPRFEVEETGPPIQDQVEVIIEDYDGCPRYAARLIKGIKIGPSPEWLASRVEAAGMRPINNVVDVTNYVMLELGQPLHAFDFAKIRGKKIVVRTAKAGDKFVTLDGVERTLRDDSLMIRDGEGPVAIAGVMGGLDSEVSEDTVDVLLESACFKPTSIRRTARLLGLPSEASRRFDKGVDPLLQVTAADRAIELIKELAGGQIARGVVDAKKEEFKRPVIRLRPSRASSVLGAEISAEEQVKLLLRLDGMEARLAGDAIEAIPPSYRPDLLEEHDLIEEVARLYGYDNIPSDAPRFKMETMRRRTDLEFASRLRERLAALGFSEIILTSFEDPRRLSLLGLADGDPRLKSVKIANPLSRDESVLRTSLVPKALACLSMNRSRGESGAIRLYEINSAFEDAGEALPIQRNLLCLAFSPSQDKTLWPEAGPDDGFYELKGVVEQILGAMGFPGARIDRDDSPEPFLHPGKSAKLMAGKTPAGRLGEVHPRVAESFDLKGPVFIAELAFDILCEYAGYVPRARAISKFPPSLRDIAVVVDETVAMEDIIRAAMKGKGPILESMTLFDVFRGDAVGAGKKSLAFHVRYQSLERTLTDDEVGAEHDRLAGELKRKVGAALR